MNTRPPLLFALHGTQEYAARVARHMALKLAELEERAFEDPRPDVCGKPQRRRLPCVVRR